MRHVEPFISNTPLSRPGANPNSIRNSQNERKNRQNFEFRIPRFQTIGNDFESRISSCEFKSPTVQIRKNACSQDEIRNSQFESKI